MSATRPVEPELRHSLPEGALFPHQAKRAETGRVGRAETGRLGVQVATVAWMQQIERQGPQSLQVLFCGSNC